MQTIRRIAAVAMALALACPAVALAGIRQLGRGTEVTCGTTPTPLDDTSISNKVSRYVLVRVVSEGVTVYVGDASVTTATGFPIDSDTPYASGVTLEKDVQLYCVATAAATVRVQEAMP